MQHTSQTMERDIRICCPNCRKDAVIDRSWTQSAIASQKSRTSQEVATEQPDAVQEQDATGDAKDSGEHGTPTENLASPRRPPSDPQPAASPYSSSVRNKDSKLNLLIDFGAQDSLVGAVWLHKLLKKLKGKSVLHVIDPRPRSLKVGRVGKGSLHWPEDVCVPLGMPPLPFQQFSKLTGTVKDEQHPCTSAEEHELTSHVVTEGSASGSSRVEPSSKPAEEDDIGSGAQPGEVTAASAMDDVVAEELQATVDPAAEWQAQASAAPPTPAEIPVVVTPTTAERAEEGSPGEVLANVECAQPPTTEEVLVPVGVVSVAVESAGKSADVPSAVPPEQPSVVVTPTTEGLAHSTTALEPPAENTTVAVTPAAEIPVRQATTATEQPSERPAPPVEVPTEETAASAVLEETPNSEKHTAGEPEALLAPATLTEERPDAREPAGLTVEAGTAAAPVSPGSSYTEDTDVSVITAMDVSEVPLRQVWALWSSDLHRPRQVKQNQP